jgi:dTDP-4-amino-4,6-dideoxyglucose
MAYFTTMNLPAPSHAHFQQQLGPYWGRPEAAVADFEQALRRFFDVPEVSTWTNCFTAIALSLLHATRGRSRRVALAGLAYRRTADIVLWAGLQPVFVDNAAQLLSMDLEALRAVLRAGDIGAILFQHPMVHIADVQAVTDLAGEFGVPVVFDSVEATGGAYRGHRIGRFGLAEAFSLHPSKVINAAEGGVLTFGSSAARAAFDDSMVAMGVLCPTTGRQQLFRLEPVHAVMGLASLEIYDEVLALHQRQFERYAHCLAPSRSLELVHYDERCDPNYKSILVRIRSGRGDDRARLMAHLETLGIGARAYYAPLHGLTQGAELPVARALAEQYMMLPVGHSVTLNDIDWIGEQILAFEARAASPAAVQELTHG